MLIDSGSASREVYFILEGAVQVIQFSPSGKEVILREITAGGLFGELAALDGGSRSASVIATAASLLARVPGDVFRDALQRCPDAAPWIARHFAGQVRTLSDKIFELSALAVRHRLHCEVLRLCESAGVVDDRAQIEPAPTHSELASRIGSHREAVTRELRYLAARGWIDQGRRKLVVNAVSVLAAAVRDAAGESEMLRKIERRTRVSALSGIAATLR